MLKGNQRNVRQILKSPSLTITAKYTDASRNVSSIKNPLVLENKNDLDLVQINAKRNVKILIKGPQDDFVNKKEKQRDGLVFHEKVIIGYSREQMCDLVFDVANYKNFLPFCANSVILKEITSPGKLNLTKMGKNNMSLNLRNFDEKKDSQLHLPKHFRARLDIGYPPIKESYISNVSMIRPNWVKSVSRDTNMFEYLINEWKFHPNPHCYERSYLNSLTEAELKELEKSCLIEFYVSFKFVNVLYSTLSSVFMDQIFKKMVEAFSNRARELYGKPSVLSKRVQ